MTTFADLITELQTPPWGNESPKDGKAWLTEHGWGIMIHPHTFEPLVFKGTEYYYLGYA